MNYQKINLHIVTKDDTLDSLCKQYNCDKKDVIKLNHLLNENLFINKPLLIPTKEENRNIANFNISNKQTITLLYMIKETYLSSLLFEELFEIEFNNTSKYIDSLAILPCIKEYLKKLLSFPIYLKRKDTKQLVVFEDSLEKELLSLKTKCDENIFNNLNYLNEQFQLYLLKIGNKNYNEALKIFENIYNTTYLN